MDQVSRMTEHLLNKYVSEEMMTKSAFLEAEAKIFEKFENGMEKKLNAHHRWLMGIGIAILIAIFFK